MWRAVLVAALGPWAAWAEGEAPGGHDHYVLALTWQPAWCALEGEAACHGDLGWTLHGLWPQHEEGWPSWCPTDAPAPTRAEVAAMADLMGSGTLAGHQWRKHGTCSGLSGQGYLALSRRAFEAVTRPAILERVEAPLRIAPAVVEAAFLEANPGLTPDGVTITCREGRILEARICLTRGLEPRPCSPEVARDCAADAPLFEPIR